MNSFFTNKFFLNAAVAGALLLCVFFATYTLTESPAVWYDEGFHTEVAAYIATHGTQALQVAPNAFLSTQYVTAGFPFLYPVALSYHLFGIGVLQGRGVMVCFIILFLFAAYALTRRLMGLVPAAYSAILLASFPMLYGNGKSVLGEVPGLFYLMLALMALLALERSGYKSIKWYALAGLSAGLCVATKPIFLLLLGAYFITYLFKFKKIPLQLRGVLAGGAMLLAPLALWMFLQFGPDTSLHTLLSFYANPYSSQDIVHVIAANALRFFTESTPIYTLGLMLVWGAALFIRRKNGSVSSAEIAAFSFAILVLASYLRLPGWYRYLFEALTVALLFLPSSLFAIYSFALEKFPHTSLKKFSFLPYAALLVLAGAQSYQTAFHSYVSQYYASTATAQLSSAFAALPPGAYFLYNVPQMAVLLPTQRYYQYLVPNERLSIGKEELSELHAGTADFAVTDSDDYQKHLPDFSRYSPYQSIAGYEILRRKQ